MFGIVVSCLYLCKSLYYANGFEIEGDKKSCFCADLISKESKPPLDLTLRLPKKYFEQKEELYGPAY